MSGGRRPPRPGSSIRRRSSGDGPARGSYRSTTRSKAASAVRAKKSSVRSTSSRRGSRKRPTEARRRVPIVLSAIGALVILATGLPVAGLLSQHHQQAQATAELATLRAQNKALVTQERQLNSPEEVKRLARDRYQFVEPGQTLYQVLPSQSSSTTASAGDPASQPLVSPNRAPDMTPDPDLPTAATQFSSTARGTTSRSTSTGQESTGQETGSFWSRVADTFEFWK